MNIKRTLQEIVKYINNKLIKGDYIFIGCGEHTAKVAIDDIEFNVWISNGPASCELHVSGSSSVFGEIYHEDLSDEQRMEISRLLMPKVIQYRKEVLLREKEKELAALKQQIKAGRDDEAEYRKKEYTIFSLVGNLKGDGEKVRFSVEPADGGGIEISTETIEEALEYIENNNGVCVAQL